MINDSDDAMCNYTMGTSSVISNTLIEMLNRLQKCFFLSTVKLPIFKHLPNRTELNTNSSRRTALELFDYF